MWKNIAVFLLPFVKGALLRLLRDNKEKLIAEINAAVDVPIIDEKDEEKVFRSIYNLIELLVTKGL